MTYSIEKITTLIGARRYGESETTVGWLLTDSRSLCFPEQTLFFALRTQHGDGHRYIDDLYRRGVCAFVVEQVPDDYATHYPSACFLRVQSSLAALQRLAERHRDEFGIPVVGITGSNGKTWVKEWLYQLLLSGQRGPVTRSPRSYNSQIGVPLSVWLLNERSRVALFEAGISQPGEMETLRDIIQPTIGVFTTLGAAPQEHLRSLEEKCMEKLQLFHGAKAIVYPSDDDIVSRCMRRSGFSGEKIGWSRQNPTAPFYVESLTPASHLTYIYKGTRGAYTIPFSDEASIENSITCAATALYLGMTPDEVAEGMARLEPIAMRLEVKQGQRGLTLINDSYNSDINSLDIALDFLMRRADTSSSTLILSDIFQSGASPEALYRQVAELLQRCGVNRFVGIGPELSAQAAVISTSEKLFFPDTESFLRSNAIRSLHDSVVLIKGARSFGFERISEQLEQKVHETILEVNLPAIVDNLNHFRAAMKPGTRLVCMIKADAYGAGAIEIARTLQEHRVDYLAVAVADEGVALREAGITSNIMVMNPEMSSFKTLFDYGLEPEVYSFRLLDALIHAARKEGIAGWPVHVKLDTGMHRLGFNVDEIDRLVTVLKHQQALMVRSVFSHFVGSDSPEFDDFSARQFELFDRGSRQLQAAFPHKILRHIDNSAGIEHFPDRQLDMCRLGIGLYRGATALKTTILQLRNVKAGDSVGYSRRTILERDSVIAAIPIGYADGLDRHLGNRHGYCIVGGQQAPYVGNICMDVAMVDVTGIDCHEGDMVEIFGPQLPPEMLAQQLDTIDYEVMTSVSNRVKRIYYQD